MNRAEILHYAEKKYGTAAEYLWRQYPDWGVLRHRGNRKWYAVLMSVSAPQLRQSGEEPLDILNVKCDPMEGDYLRQRPGFLPGYHMNHQNWLTILLDGSVPKELVLRLLDASYEMTGEKKARAEKTAGAEKTATKGKQPAKRKCTRKDAARSAGREERDIEEQDIEEQQRGEM